jgi:hypothetical protein
MNADPTERCEAVGRDQCAPSAGKYLLQLQLQAQDIPSLALPNGLNSPPHGLKRGSILCVALDISSQLRIPVGKVGSWLRSQRALGGRMLVPKAPVHEQDNLSSAEHNVGLARKVRRVKPVPVT